MAETGGAIINLHSFWHYKLGSLISVKKEDSLKNGVSLFTEYFLTSRNDQRACIEYLCMPEACMFHFNVKSARQKDRLLEKHYIIVQDTGISFITPNVPHYKEMHYT